MTASQLDSLKRRNPPEASGSKSPARSGWWLIALPLGFALLCFLLFGERLLPLLEVRTAPALIVETASPETAASTTLTQASGWIEPAPYPIRVPVKVDGLVESVEVLEGETVKAGQLLASLDPVDFEYRLKSLEGALQAAQAAQAEKEASVLRAGAESRRAKAGMVAAEARLYEQTDRLRRVLALDDGVLPEDDRLQVEREVAVGKADLAAAEAEWQSHLAHQDVEKAGVKNAGARVLELQALVDRARIDLARTKIYAPMDGVVLKRYASPGGKRMRGMDDPESATVVSLFDPARLQVRVDVPLADVAGVEIGTPAKIQLSVFSGRTFSGKVTRILGEADLTRNTLQVKVAIENPDPRLRPEMLCRVEFYSFPKLGTEGSPAFRASESVWIPENALDGQSQVWVVDPVSLRAELRSVEPGTDTRENYRKILQGLRPGERVVVNAPANLKPGQRVKEIKGDRL